MDRVNIGSGSPWEDTFGYSRAVKKGSIVEVAGTTATDGNGHVVSSDPYEQAKFCFQKIERALIEAGSSMKHVVRTRMLVTDISQFEAFGKAHAEFFRDIKPAATMVEVKGFIDPEMLIEIEVTAILDD